MIIVSQDKEQIINLDNVTRFFIEDFSEEGDDFGIGADTNSAESQCWDLGYYKTEERAKEVLQEIGQCLLNTEILKYVNNQLDVIALNKLQENAFEYEMPAE